MAWKIGLRALHGLVIQERNFSGTKLMSSRNGWPRTQRPSYGSDQIGVSDRNGPTGTVVKILRLVEPFALPVWLVTCSIDSTLGVAFSRTTPSPSVHDPVVVMDMRLDKDAGRRCEQCTQAKGFPVGAHPGERCAQRRTSVPTELVRSDVSARLSPASRTRRSTSYSGDAGSKSS